ncbi:MAG: HAD-IA family hydrolase [Paenibacillaceae bacterium]
MIKAIIFDFDGLILDTETPGYHTYREMFEELGAKLPLVEWVKGIGTQGGDFHPLDYLEQQIGSKVDRVQFKSQAEAKHLALIQNLTVRPGVVNYLQAAQIKPDPQLYLQALEHLGIKNTEAIVFEDSLNGLRAAKAAGIYCVVVPNEVTSQLNFVMHDLRLASMEDMSLEDIINNIV